MVIWSEGALNRLLEPATDFKEGPFHVGAMLHINGDAPVVFLGHSKLGGREVRVCVRGQVVVIE